MPGPLSRALRERISQAILAGNAASAIAERFSVSPRTVRRYRQQLRNFRRWILSITWGVLSVIAVLPIVVASFPPLLDYYQWVFEAHLVSLLISGSGDGVVGELYSLNWLPIPNMASDIIMGLLSL